MLLCRLFNGDMNHVEHSTTFSYRQHPTISDDISIGHTTADGLFSSCATFSLWDSAREKMGFLASHLGAASSAAKQASLAMSVTGW